MTKADARKAYLQKRMALPDAEYQYLNAKLYDQFFLQLDLKPINCIHLFLPIESKREPNTWPIIERLRKDFPHIRISLPLVEGDELRHIFFEGEHQLGRNKWGILEPAGGMPTQIQEIDIVIVPLLAYDKLGNRVGYGKGFYDQFLAECRIRTLRIGISFFEPLQLIEDVAEHDVTLTHCLTPLTLYSFGNVF